LFIRPKHVSFASTTRITIISLTIGAILPAVWADEVAPISTEEVLQIVGQPLDRESAMDSVERLLSQQGVDFSAAGGVSALPVLNGFMGDRIKVLIDGADITAACANHMNPPLSYVSASQVQAVTVMAGISPVSMAGDNIAGVIAVTSLKPIYSENPQIQWHSGSLAAGYRSNNQATQLAVDARLASQTLSVDYQGSFEDADSYEDGSGNKVLDTLYRVQNHVLTAALRSDQQQLAIKLNHQAIPFQGFANQYMDMTDNRSTGLTVQYLSDLHQLGDIQAQINWHGVEHSMGFFSDEKTGMMPMRTAADDYSYQLKWSLPINAEHSVQLGNEYYTYHLQDWWPAIDGSMMMGPNDYININEGRRSRLAIFAEFQSQYSPAWLMVAGVRLEQVRTDTGEVQAYSSMGMSAMDHQAALAFNTADRAKRDNLLDVSLMARYTFSENQQLEVGVARKNRAPNLYERYSWGRGIMATTMIGWFGDANGYVGDINLRPETAYTLSASYQFNGNDWQLQFSPYYTEVQDFIDATVISSFNRSGPPQGERHILQFTNLDATLYGFDLKANWLLSATSSAGQWRLSAAISEVRGKRQDGDEYLYQLKPLTSNLALQYQRGDWLHSISWQWLAAKDRLDTRRFEQGTDSYHVLNLQSVGNWQAVQLSLSIDNLLDSDYQQPLGGVNIAQYNKDPSIGFEQLAGQGRSINVGLRYAF
jgi:iron complex outermembrane recepter protein